MSEIIFDSEEALERVDGDLEFLTELTLDFLASFPNQLVELQTAVKSSDSLAAEKKAHSLKGALKNLSGKKSAETAFALEQAGRNSNLEVMPQLLIEFESNVKEFETEFRAFIAGRESK